MSQAIQSATHKSIKEEMIISCTEINQNKINFIQDTFNSEFNFLYEYFLNEKNENKFTDNGFYEVIKNGNDLIKEKKENKCFIKPKNTWNKKEKKIFKISKKNLI